LLFRSTVNSPRLFFWGKSHLQKKPKSVSRYFFSLTFTDHSILSVMSVGYCLCVCFEVVLKSLLNLCPIPHLYQCSSTRVRPTFCRFTWLAGRLRLLLFPSFSPVNTSEFGV
jgi:hypothetical protein